MRIYLGADHRGFEIKEQLKSWLQENEHEVEDIGCYVYDPDNDYVDFALKVAEAIEGDGTEDRGILLCGSGHGVDIVANKFKHVRAIIGFNAEVTIQGREHEDANILVIPTDWTTADEAVERVELFLKTEKNDSPNYVRRRSRLNNLQIR
jgi:ribose 5-phosphate isomerase B